MNNDLMDFLAARVVSWTGLTAAHAEELRTMAGANSVVLPGQLGEPPVHRKRLSLPTATFSGGLFAWLIDEVIVTLEGCLPSAPEGAMMVTPALGDPDLMLPFPLGSVLMPEAEWVFASRGLAVRLNLENGVLLGLVGFEPTTPDNYVRRLRPLHRSARFLRDASPELRDVSAGLRDVSAGLRDFSAGVGL